MLQDFAALTIFLEKFPPSKFLEAMSDFHLLMFLASSDMLPLKVFYLFYFFLWFDIFRMLFKGPPPLHSKVC